jgi:hypothetical protein
MLAVAIIIVWVVTGPLFDYSDTWQLIINTGTTIITFLMVFLIQNTQNREAALSGPTPSTITSAVFAARSPTARTVSWRTTPSGQLKAPPVLTDAGLRRHLISLLLAESPACA